MIDNIKRDQYIRHECLVHTVNEGIVTSLQYFMIHLLHNKELIIKCSDSEIIDIAKKLVIEFYESEYSIGPKKYINGISEFLEFKFKDGIDKFLDCYLN